MYMLYNGLNYSVLMLFTGLAKAAFITCALTLANATATTSNDGKLNIHQDRST